jgi:DNA-binding CsgD family transcriptional regulator
VATKRHQDLLTIFERDRLSNIETAAALFVSRKTVEAHLTRVYRKLGIRSRTELTRLMVTCDETR